jgi:hypothetical protein
VFGGFYVPPNIVNAVNKYGMDCDAVVESVSQNFLLHLNYILSTRR